LVAGSAAPLCGGEVAVVVAGACYGGSVVAGAGEMKRKTRRSHWWGFDYETRVKEGRIVKGELRAGQGCSSEEF
jgi:hypothetical protein